jgi:phosphopantothenoylcysteine decarboxylase/phosphopantothenate--cysteine ligase
VIGFAAETDHVDENARRNLTTKGCDWIVANNVSAEQNTFGNVDNAVILYRRDRQPEAWPLLTKVAVAERLVQRIAGHLDERRDGDAEAG